MDSSSVNNKLSVSLVSRLVRPTKCAAEVSVRAESWSLPRRDGNGEDRERERFARRRRSFEWFRRCRCSMLLHNRTFHRREVRRSRSENWQQLQSVHVSALEMAHAAPEMIFTILVSSLFPKAQVDFWQLED